jgi:hypothetical protein
MKQAITPSSVGVTNIQAQPDIVIGQATALKVAFDKTGLDEKTYINSTLISELNGDNGSKKIGHDSPSITADNVGDAIEEVWTNIVMGQVSNGSIIDVKLSDAAGNIKDRFATHLADYASLLINSKYPPSPYVAAVGNGIADDTAALQVLLTYIGTNGGGSLYLPTGTYKISSRLDVPVNTTVFGAGIDKTIIAWDETDLAMTATSAMIEFADNTSGLSKIYDLTLNQKRAERGLLDNQTYGGIHAANGLEIYRVKIFNSVGPGITQASIDNIKIRDCVIYDTGHHAIYFSTGNAGYIKNVEISNNYIGTPDTIVGRLFEANLVKFRFSASNDLLQNVTIKNNRLGAAIDSMGIFVSTTSGGTCIIQSLDISDNKINQGSDITTGMTVGIYVGSDSKAEDVAIVNNYVYGNAAVGTYGIRFLVSDITNTNSVVISKNTCKNVEIGIDCNKATLVSENYILFTKYGFVGISGKLYNNIIESTTNNAVGVRQSTFDVIENVITLSGTGTIGIDFANSTNLMFIKNRITGAAQGILRNAKTLTGCIMEDNVFVSCTANYVGVTNSTATMKNNIFEPGVRVKSGVTADRHTPLYVGETYYDTTISKPIWWNGTVWKDSAGTTV